jgi:plastocyanin
MRCITPSPAVLLALSAALFCAACAGSSTPSSTTTTTTSTTTTTIPAAAGVSVSIVRGADALTTNAYSPNPITVAVGTAVTWTNNDVVDHDATADDKSFATGLIAPGRSASVTLRAAGRLTYYCTLHPGMTGTLFVQ